MFVSRLEELPSERVVNCPLGGFVSHRILLDADRMGFGLHITQIPVGPPQHWHYTRHKEACFCIKGVGLLTDANTGECFEIRPGSCYVLDNHDDHYFQAIEDVELVSIFNPPCKGREVHDENGSY